MELFKIADDLLAGREFFFDHFTAPDAHFFWCQRRARQFELDLSGFKHCTAHFERMMQRPSVQKLLAFENRFRTNLPKLPNYRDEAGEVRSWHLADFADQPTVVLASAPDEPEAIKVQAKGPSHRP